MNLNIESNTSSAACGWGVCLVRDVLHHACIMVENNHITAMTSMNNRTHSGDMEAGSPAMVKLTESKKISIMRVLFSSRLSPFFFDCNRGLMLLIYI